MSPAGSTKLTNLISKTVQLDSSYLNRAIACINDYSGFNALPTYTPVQVNLGYHKDIPCIAVCGEYYGIIMMGSRACIIINDDGTWFVNKRIPHIFDSAWIYELNKLTKIAWKYLEEHGTPRYYSGFSKRYLCGFTLK